MREHDIPSTRKGLHGLGPLLLVPLLAAITACTSTGAPCLAYSPTYLTKTVSLRGYGAVQMTEKSMVCTERADVAAAD